MKTYTVAVLGATGAVGQEMINILQERNFPVGKLIPLASARSAGKTLKFRGEDVVICEACDEAFQGVDIVLGAAENDIAQRFAPAIVAAGAVFVDNSSAFRMDPKVPLVAIAASIFMCDEGVFIRNSGRRICFLSATNLA